MVYLLNYFKEKMINYNFNIGLIKVPLLLLSQNTHGIVMSCLKINKVPIGELPKWEEIATTVILILLFIFKLILLL